MFAGSGMDAMGNYGSPLILLPKAKKPLIPKASVRGESHNSGVITPATTLAKVVWVKPCSDEAVPRRLGKISMINRVMVGDTSDIPTV